MKTTLKLLTTLTITMMLSTAAQATMDHSHDDIPTTQELGVYDEIQELVEKSSTKNKMFGAPGPFIGLPMRYPVFPNPQAEQQTAVAANHNGQKIVLYGPMAARRLGPAVMGYVLQHEYAHHDLGHMGGSVATREADADCYAAKSLVSAGRMNIVGQSINYHRSQGCNYNPNTPIYMVNQSHPCGTQRANILNTCSQQAASDSASRSRTNTARNSRFYGQF